MNFDLDTAKAELKTREPDFLTPAKKMVGGAVTYICPACGNGSGRDGDGIAPDPTAKGGRRWKCFKCGINEDIIGLWKLHAGAAGDREAFAELYEHYHINPGGDSSLSALPANAEQERRRPETEEAEADYTDFFLEANRRIEETNYYRGISLQTLNRFKVGFVPNWTHPKAPQAPPSPRLIIPTSRNSYLARDTRTSLEGGGGRYAKSKVGKVRIFNRKALANAERPVFVVEGELDALSVIDVGGEAVALGSTANKKLLFEILKNDKPRRPLILSLDNDQAGREATEEIIKGLPAGVPCLVHNVAQPHKDANEALMEDREAFAERVKRAIERAESLQDEAEAAARQAEEERRRAYLQTSAANYLQNFIDGINDSVNTPCISTGFFELDLCLDGGLYEGLYILGAISSLGKTTLALQIADNIAQSGGDALIFSLEMARNELIAKSVSRLTLLDVRGSGGDARNAKTARGITAGARYERYNPTEREIITRAFTTYHGFANNIYIVEGVGDVGAVEIREAVKRHIALTGKRPVVFIDYLQILAPADVRASDKQNMDKAVLELRRICRDCKVTIIAISSLNRASYKDAIGMEAFKESGAIEYAADVLIGLQLEGAGKKDFNPTEAKRKDPREVELIILKNRNAATGRKVAFRYYPAFNFFEEDHERIWEEGAE